MELPTPKEFFPHPHLPKYMYWFHSFPNTTSPLTLPTPPAILYHNLSSSIQHTLQQCSVFHLHLHLHLPSHVTPLYSRICFRSLFFEYACDVQ
jgi:hypothetical protein